MGILLLSCRKYLIYRISCGSLAITVWIAIDSDRFSICCIVPSHFLLKKINYLVLLICHRLDCCWFFFGNCLWYYQLASYYKSSLWSIGRSHEIIKRTHGLKNTHACIISQMVMNLQGKKNGHNFLYSKYKSFNLNCSRADYNFLWKYMYFILLENWK